MNPSEFSSGGFLYKIERISFKIDVDCLYDIKKASVGRTLPRLFNKFHSA